MEDELLEIPINPREQKYMSTQQDMIFGNAIDPRKRMDIFSPSEFEEFIELWVMETLGKEYTKVVRCGGAGDLGRDIIAYKENNRWDNYQCKHYKSALTPTDIWVEIGKLSYYTFLGKYYMPDKYFFICQQSLGTKLITLLEKPEELKKKFIENWDKYCAKYITKRETIKLVGEFLEYVNNLDFSIFTYKTQLEMIKPLEGTLAFSTIFGGGLKRRREVPRVPPKEIQKIEQNYVKKLLLAYNDSTSENDKIMSEVDLVGKRVLKDHFERQRLHFYAAESLLELERDANPKNDTYNKSLKDIIYSSVIDTVESDYKNGFERVKAVTDRARLCSLSAHPLLNVTHDDDKHGICHHLANEDRIEWVIKNEEE